MERGAAVRRPRRAHGACGSRPAPPLPATSFKSETDTLVFAAVGGAGRPLRGVRRPAAVRRAARGPKPLHAVDATQDKRSYASPRPLRSRLRRIPGRRRRHGHVLEEHGRLALKIPRERRRGQHRQSDDKHDDEQRAGG